MAAAKKKKRSQKVEKISSKEPINIELQPWQKSAIFISCLGFLFYLNTAWNDYSLDDHLVMKNHRLTAQGIKSIPQIFQDYYYKDNMGYAYGYRPITHTSFAIQYSLFGDDPTAGHLLNVLLYATICGALYFLLLVLLGREKWGFSLAVSLLFVVHPIHSEVVNNIKNRDELLAFLFALTSLYTALRFIDATGRRNQLIWLVLTALLFLLGMLSKPSMLMWAFLIPAAVVFFREISLVKLFALVTTIGLASIFLVNDTIALYFRNWIFNNDGSGMAHLFDDYNPFLLPYYLFKTEHRHITQNHGLFYYYQILLTAIILFPFCLKIGIQFIRSFSNEIFKHQLEQLKKEKKKLFIGLGIFSVAALLTFILSFQESAEPTVYDPNPTQLNESKRYFDLVENPLVYDEFKQYQKPTSIYIMGYYLKLLAIPYPLRFYYGYNMIEMKEFKDPSVIISAIVLLSILILSLWAIRWSRVVAFAGISLLMCLLLISNLQVPIAGIVAERLAFPASLFFCMFIIAPVYKWIQLKTEDPKMFWRQNMRIIRITTSILIAATFIYVFQRNRDWKNQITLYRNDIQHLQESAQAHNLLATQYGVIVQESSIPEVKRKYGDSAIHEFYEALRISPDFFNARFDLARIYSMLGNHESAIEQYRITHEMQPTYSLSKVNLGNAFYELGQYDSSLANHLEAIEIYKHNIQSFTQAASIYFSSGRLEQALALNNEGIRHNPKVFEFYLNKGKILVKMGRKQEAIEPLERAYQLNPKYEPLLQALVSLLDETGNKQKADFYAEKWKVLQHK